MRFGRRRVCELCGKPVWWYERALPNATWAATGRPWIVHQECYERWPRSAHSEGRLLGYGTSISRKQPPDRPLSRTRRGSADLCASWQKHATAFVSWARKPGHDSYWRFHRDLFLELVPAPGSRTLDLGCGEGRLSRDLKALGHEVVGVDVSPTMLEAAREADPQIETHLADAAALPFSDAAFDCVVAHLSLQDVDDLAGACRETARVLEPGGRFCVAIVHPLNSAGEFAGDEADSPFVISGSYLDESFYEDNVARDGLEMTFVSAHRPLQAYTDAINDAGMLIERLREPAAPEHAITRPLSRRWQRLPLFLHLRAVRP